MAVVLLLLVGVGAASAATHPPLTTNKGAIAADSEFASKVGAQVLENGGNAVDTAIATALALGGQAPQGSVMEALPL